MIAKSFDFSKQLDFGKKAEALLDGFYSEYYDIVPIKDKKLQRMGIDRLFCYKDAYRNWFTVEYKCDAMAGKTGNIFVEVEILHAGNSLPGWVAKLCAQKLFLYVPSSSVCYECDSLKLKQHIKSWAYKYPISGHVNDGNNKAGFSSRGLLVPVDVFILAASIEHKYIPLRLA